MIDTPMPPICFWLCIDTDRMHAHLKLSGKDKSFKCDYCSETNLTRQALYNHILNKHKKCTMCEKICPTQNSFENHMKVIHHTSSSKHTLEREPSLKNYKNKKFN